MDFNVSSPPSTTTNKSRSPLYHMKKRNSVTVLVLFAVLSCLSVRSFAAATKCPPTTPEAMVEIATYEEVKDLPNHPEKVLIDVREPSELQETGQIPTSINIPRKRQWF